MEYQKAHTVVPCMDREAGMHANTMSIFIGRTMYKF